MSIAHVIRGRRVYARWERQARRDEDIRMARSTGSATKRHDTSAIERRRYALYGVARWARRALIRRAMMPRVRRCCRAFTLPFWCRAYARCCCYDTPLMIFCWWHDWFSLIYYAFFFRHYFAAVFHYFHWRLFHYFSLFHFHFRFFMFSDYAYWLLIIFRYYFDAITLIFDRQYINSWRIVLATLSLIILASRGHYITTHH